MAVPGSPEPLSSQHGGTGGCGCLGSSRERALGSPETHLKPLLPPPAQHPGLAGCRGALGGHLGSPHLPCPITQLEGRGMPKGVAAVSGWQRCPALCWVLGAPCSAPAAHQGKGAGEGGCSYLSWGDLGRTVPILQLWQQGAAPVPILQMRWLQAPGCLEGVSGVVPAYPGGLGRGRWAVPGDDTRCHISERELSLPLVQNPRSPQIPQPCQALPWPQLGPEGTQGCEPAHPRGQPSSPPLPPVGFGVPQCCTGVRVEEESGSETYGGINGDSVPGSHPCVPALCHRPP